MTQLDNNSNVKALANVVINGEIAVNGVKVMEGEKGLFVAMPSKKVGGEFVDIAHPITDKAYEQISNAVDADANGVYTMSFSTALTLASGEKALKMGMDNVIALRYLGNANMADTNGTVTLTLQPKALEITRVTAEERTYDPARRTVRITGAELRGLVNDDDEVKLDLTNLEGTLPSGDAGVYTKLTLPDGLSLTGRHGGYYSVTGGQVPAVARIGKQPLELHVRMENWMCGDVPSVPVVTGNLGGGRESFSYKPADAADTAYSGELPEKPGRYIVKVAVAETPNYLAGEATAEFEVVAAPRLPQTGDDSRLALWLALCLLAGAGTLALGRRRSRS